MSTNTFHEQSEAAKDILSNRQNIRRFLKSNEIEMDQFNRMISRLESVRDEMMEEVEKEAEFRKEKLKKVEEAKKILQENGLSIEDLIQTERGNGLPRKQGKRRSDAGRPKHNPIGVYAYEDEQGKRQEMQMPRVGRAPAEFTEYLRKTGKKRKECLIKEFDENGNEMPVVKSDSKKDKKQEAKTQKDEAKTAAS